MTLLIAIILCPLALLTLCFAVEMIAGVRPIARKKPAEGVRASVVIVVPAHDEERIIANSLLGLKQAAEGQARILVVADNCGDSTAAFARGCGVDVIERSDPARRGKGFALDFARLQLAFDPPDTVVIVDADCAIDSASLRKLIARSQATERPCQAVYLMSPAPNGPPTVQLSTFAFFVRNAVRQRAMQRLAGRIHLVGTGMAFPWPLFAQAGLATENIVEDLQMGLELADAGHPPMLVDDAVVWSDPASEKSTIDQRRRWEGGYLQSAAAWAPRLFLHSIRRGDLGGLWAAINLLIPPLALLVMVDGGALTVGAMAAWLVGAALWPIVLMAGSLLGAGIGLLLAWVAGGRRFVGFGGLIKIPVYLVWKAPLYLGLVRRGAPKEWLRTGREET